MHNDTLQSKGKQFRGPRTRAGKLIRNRIGGFERSRGIDEYYGSSRRRLLQDALELETRCAVREVVSADSAPQCRYMGCKIPVGGAAVVEEVESFLDSLDPRVLVVRYGVDGKISSAHYVGSSEAAYLTAR